MAVRQRLFTRELVAGKWAGWLPLSLAFLATPGCNSGKPSAVALPSVDSESVAAQAMEQFDSDKNGVIDKEEMVSCPPLASAVASYDADKDGSLKTEEIAAGISRLYGSGSALTNVSCTVTQRGAPVVGATVVFRPVSMLAESIHVAQGTTDETGTAQMTVAAEHLPENLKSGSAMQPGLYHVEVTHPQRALPARYNAETELGFEVDPTSRNGLAARFDLKP